jgi:large subunit ribosomal protein L21
VYPLQVLSLLVATVYGFFGATNMYAVIKSGGKQHRVTPDELLKVELLKAEKGDTIKIEDVLMVVDGADIKIGQPVVAGAVVEAEVVEHGRGEKVRIVKHKRRKHYHKEQGHRQWYTLLKIKSINA